MLPQGGSGVPQEHPANKGRGRLPFAFGGLHDQRVGLVAHPKVSLGGEPRGRAARASFRCFGHVTKFTTPQKNCQTGPFSRQVTPAHKERPTSRARGASEPIA